jgi:hypothetical protein
VPHWLLALICFAVLAGFIGYAFHRGMKVSSDRNNTNTGPSQNDYPPGPMVATTRRRTIVALGQKRLFVAA